MKMPKITPDNAIVTVRLKYAGDFVLWPIVVKPGEQWELTLLCPNIKTLNWMFTVNPTLKLID